MSKSEKVVVFSTVHKILDTRISYRQVQSLQKAGYQVKLYAVESPDPDIEGVELVHLKKSKFRLSRFINGLTLFFKLKRDNADIYHFHDPELIITGILLAKSGRKVIFDSHEHYPDAIIERHCIPVIFKSIFASFYTTFERIGLRRFSGLIVADEMNEENYKNKNINLALIHNYPLNNIILSEEEIGNKGSGNTLLYLGKIFEIRGIENLLEIMSIVKESIPTVKLRLVGELYPDDYKDVLDKKISALGIESTVSIEEPVPYFKIGEVTRTSDIGLMIFRPTRNNLQIPPNKLVEYMAGGLPIVASDFPAMGEIIRTLKSGVLVDPDNITKAAEEIIELLNDHKLREQMAKNGYKAVKEKYNWETESKKLIEFYNSIN